MKKQTKKTAGMSMGIVIIFIMVMSVAVTALLVVSVNALRSANRLPQIDGDYFSAEAAMNRAMPEIATALTSSPIRTEVARDIRNAARTVTTTTNNLIADIVAADNVDTRSQVLTDALENDTVFMTTLNARINTLMTNTPGFTIPGRTPGQNGAPTQAGGAANIGAGSEHFYMIRNNTNFSEPLEGFNAPAFINIDREDNGDVRVGISTRVTENPVAGNLTITVIPYITLISEAGSAEIYESITLPVSSFILERDAWNQNTTYNQGLGPGGYTFTTATGNIGSYPPATGNRRIWLVGAGSAHPNTYSATQNANATPDPDNSGRGYHRNSPGTYLSYAYTHAVRRDPTQVGIGNTNPNRPTGGAIAMYAAPIPPALITFLETLFTSATFHPTLPTGSPHTWVLTNPFNITTHPAEHAAIQSMIAFVGTTNGANMLPRNGHFGGMSDVTQGGMRCPYRHALYFLMRLGHAINWQNTPVQPVGIGAGNAFPTASVLPASNTTQLYIPAGDGDGATGWWPAHGLRDSHDLSNLLRTAHEELLISGTNWRRINGEIAVSRPALDDNGNSIREIRFPPDSNWRRENDIPNEEWNGRENENTVCEIVYSTNPRRTTNPINARYLRITQGANSERYLHGTISLPNLQGVHADTLRISGTLNFTGTSSVTRFNIGSDSNGDFNAVNSPINATINNVHFVAGGNVQLNLGADGRLLGNSIYMARGNQFIIQGSGRITVGASDLAPQFFSRNHISLDAVGDYHGVFASARSNNPMNPPPAGSTLVGMALGNYHPQANNTWVPGTESLSATMIDNAFERIRRTIMSQAGGSGGGWTVRTDPAGFTADIQSPTILRLR
ncbi:MAG: hypothetical protein FWE27_05785 [Defluviitaleaceae bacterium]|nr:hypothetical protein [Defluviitaleaceae bacterium]